jgi:hypothetical protein
LKQRQQLCQPIEPEGRECDAGNLTVRAGEWLGQMQDRTTVMPAHGVNADDEMSGLDGTPKTGSVGNIGGRIEHCGGAALYPPRGFPLWNVP